MKASNSLIIFFLKIKNCRLLNDWTELNSFDALELLSAKFPDSQVWDSVLSLTTAINQIITIF